MPKKVVKKNTKPAAIHFSSTKAEGELLAQAAADYLNSVLEVNPREIEALFDYQTHRLPEMEDHPHCVIDEDDRVTLMGLINGLLRSLHKQGFSFGPVAACRKEERLVAFIPKTSNAKPKKKVRRKR